MPSAGSHARLYLRGLPGANVDHADGVALHVRLIMQQAAQVEVDRLAGADVGGAGGPAHLGGQHIAGTVLRVDANLRGGGGGAVVDQLALHAQAGGDASAGGAHLDVLDGEISSRACCMGGDGGDH